MGAEVLDNGAAGCARGQDTVIFDRSSSLWMPSICSRDQSVPVRAAVTCASYQPSVICLAVRTKPMTSDGYILIAYNAERRSVVRDVVLPFGV